MLHGPKNGSERAIIWCREHPKNLKEPLKSKAMTPGDMSRLFGNEAIAYYSTANRMRRNAFASDWHRSNWMGYAKQNICKFHLGRSQIY
jgi:hypothetical protein